MDLFTNIPMVDIVCWIFFIVLGIFGIEAIKLILEIYRLMNEG